MTRPHGLTIGRILQANSFLRSNFIVLIIIAGCAQLDVSLEIGAAVEETMIIVDFSSMIIQKFEMRRLMVRLPNCKHNIIDQLQ